MPAIPDVRITGPFTHDNLTVFLIHGKDQFEGTNLLTLQEAIEQEKLVVHETGSVNELAVENVAAVEEVFIESGEIVKGGRQDRVLVADVVIPAKSGKIPMAAFCVEQGRWSPRGGEDETTFSESSSTLVSKDLRLGTRMSKSQADVWSSVDGVQRKLSRKLRRDVKSRRSKSSLQLTLEDEDLRKASAAYEEALAGAVEGKDDVVGFAFAVNGELNTADVYASSSLFRKLWPKRLAASAVEAVAEREEGETSAPPVVEEVLTFLGDVEAGETTEERITKRIRVVRRETETNVLFETRDSGTPTDWLHRNYMKK